MAEYLKGQALSRNMNVVSLVPPYLYARRMKKIILFFVCLMLFQHAYSQTNQPISGYLCIAHGFQRSGFDPDPDTACAIACSNVCLADDCFTWIASSPDRVDVLGRPLQEGCFDISGLFRAPTSPVPTQRCLTPQGYIFPDYTGGEARCSLAEDKSTEETGCTVENKEQKHVGNPCNVATGNKYQSETDFNTAGLSFTRSYNSQNLANLGLGAGWRHNFQRKLSIDGNALTHISGNGRGEPWTKTAGVWQGEPDSDVAIVETSSGFELTKANDVVETYNSFGQLLTITDTNGQLTSYTYNANNQLETVTNYNEFNLSHVIDALGSEYRFEYYPNGNLESVIYPDTTATDDSDNPRRTYHYDDTNYPSHLTGITDENGDRYATWEYNAEGKAILTKHAETSTQGVGQETFELDYQAEAAQ